MWCLVSATFLSGGGAPVGLRREVADLRELGARCGVRDLPPTAGSEAADLAGGCQGQVGFAAPFCVELKVRCGKEVVQMREGMRRALHRLKLRRTRPSCRVRVGVRPCGAVQQ